MAKLARNAFATLVSLLFVFMWLAAGNPDPLGPWIAALAQGAPCGPNPVACENARTGDADFEISGAGGSTIQGFATDISVNAGQTVSFKISAPGAASYAIDIYRLGYYGGAGARKVATIAPSAMADQPACLTDSATALVDCGNWSVSASWIVPFDAVSGVYIAKPTRPDNGEASHIYFVVRDDNRAADILVQTSDTTWQAYNRYGGASLYCADTNGVSNAGSAYANSCARRAAKVSYNRPFDTRAHSPQSFLFSAEYPMLRFLEANGYDVKYWAGVDTDRRGADLAGAKKPKVFLSSGHDEYWSADQRARVEAARDAGVHLAFFSGNEIYWKTRYEPSTASTDEATSHPAYRTLVSYKDTLAGVKLDPMPKVATGTWRDTRFAPPVADGGRPENALIGSIWTVNSGTSAIAVPPSMANLRLWRNTRIASQGGGTLAPSSLGYEWGEDLDNGSRPAGVIHLSATRVDGVEKIVDFGSTVAIGTATHNLTLYRHASGALVFGASTVQWAWGLDGAHDDHGQSLPSHTPDLAMQQATVNLLADMGAQPASLQASLVGSAGSTDTLAPTTTIGSPAVGASVGSGDRVLISGTASDNGGGAVAGVEVSVDGGATWRPALGTAAWTFEWSAGAPGAATLRARAIDDSGNQENPGASLAVSVVAGRCPCPSIWSASTVPAVPDVDDPSPVELGLKFRSDLDGFVKGVRFYKGIGNSGTHVGNLWTTSGSLLARATFTGETATGWQQVLFDEPVEIAANTTYVVSYHTNVGHYAASPGYFSTLGADAAPLHALATGIAGGNGVYKYGATDFPTDTFNASNYWVDVVFDSTTDTTKPVISDVAAIAVDSSTALISWKTNEPATSNVDYSTDSAFPPALTLHASNPGLTTVHQVRITGLRANTRYVFRLKSTDRAGNEATWPPAGPDPQPGPGGTPAPREFTTPKPTLHDTTAADFSAGTSTSVHIGEDGDGELVLLPASGVEFSGTTLPAGWSSSIWSPGGSAVVDLGRLTVDGARVLRDLAESGPGHSLEFVATFTGDPYQHSGLGQTLASAFEPLALFSTSWMDVDGTPRAGGSLAVRTSIGDGSEMSTNLGPAYFNAPHRYRIDWQPGGITYFVDGVQVASHAIAISTQMRPVAASDFNAFSGTITVDWIRLSPYAAAGSFLSRVFDAGAAVDWHDIRWTADTPDGTSLDISLRSGMTPVPDDTWTAFVPVAAPGAFGMRSRYLQYRARLATSVTERTPQLSDIVISSTQPSLTAANDHATVAENGNHLFPASGPGSLTANDADSNPAATLRVVSLTAPAHGAAVLGADGSVTYTPATNYHGADLFGYTVSDGMLTADATVTIDVTGNIAPVATDDSYAVGEDGAINVPAASGLLVNDTDAEHDPLTARLVSPPAHGVLALSGDGSFSYSPAENYTGTDAFTYKANDGFGDSLVAATVRISVAPVNDRPSFTKGADPVVLEDAGPQTLVGWATGISAGAPAESAQVLNFIVATTNTTLFAAGPAISPDGTLSYTPAPNANGSAVVTVRLHDNGGSPGVDTSDPQTFGIVVTAVNDAPGFVQGANQTVLEDAGAQTVAGWATAISAGAADESAQALNFIVSNDNASLFLVEPSISAGGTLTYTPTSNRSGSATVTVRLHDNGGAAGGADTSPAQTFIITVSAVNDPPSFTRGADQTLLEDAGSQAVAGWATALNPGAPDETGQTIDFIVTSNNDALFAVPPAISANGTLTYRPAADANGTATVTVRLHDNGGVASGVDTSAPQTFTIAVAAVNDAPTFTKGADQAAAEDAGLQSVASWATLISVGPANESGQVATFSIAGNTNPSLFATGPAIDASGKLTYTPAANASGTATITLRLTDNGGVASNGVESSPAQAFVITVAARNDAPSFTKGADQTVPEDAGAQSVAWATNISAGASDEAAQALDFIVANSNTPLFSVQPAISAGGTLSYTPAPNANGSATVTVRLHDNGGTAGGGADTSAAQTFTITITPGNDAPVAVSDNAATTMGVAVTIPVLANDTDVDGTTLSVVSLTASTGVTVIANTGGTVSYTPAADFLGSDTFTYRARDAFGGISEPATGSVIVGLKSVTQGASANQPVTTGATALPADPVQSSVTSPVNATVSVTTGVVSESAAPDGYTFLNRQVNISVAAPNGADITADPANPIVVTFTVDASAIPAGETIQTIQILRNDVALAECPGATAIPAGPDPCIKARAVLAGGDADGDFRFTVLTTHASRWNFALRRVVVNPQAANDRYTVAAGATLSVAAPGVLGNDLARNAMTAVLVSPPSGTFTLNPNGGFAFTPAAGGCADVSFTYEAIDKNGSSNVATATIAVQCAPVADDDAFETLEDVAVTGNVLVGDTPDPDSGALQAIKVSGPAHGALTLNADGTFTYTPALNYSGVDSFAYKATDGALQSAAATVQLTIAPVNDAPTFTRGGNHTSASASAAQVVAAWATGISAGPNEAGQLLDFVLTNDNPGLFIVQPTVSPAGALAYTPKAGDGGVAQLTVRLHDNGGTANGGMDSSSAQSFTITVPAANTAPGVTVTSSSSTVNEGSPVTLTATGTDADPGEVLSFAWDLNGDGLYETPGSSVTFTPTNGPATLTPRIKVTDRGGLTAVASVSITVTNVAPVVSDTIVWNGDSTIVEPIAKARTPFTATVSLTDAGKGDTHTVTYAWGDGSATATSGGVVTESNGAGTAVGTHTYTQPGFYTVTVTVADGADTVTTATQSVVVVDPAGKFLTGLGSFTSPVGSVVSKPTLGGSGAINALTAKYGPDGTLTYAGNTNAFRFTHATGGVSLTSTKMSWIVVNGNKTWLKGEGNVTVAGVVQPATYLVAAVDATASPSVDKIRVRIVNRVSAQVIYDTQKGAIETAEASTSTPIYTTVSLK